MKNVCRFRRTLYVDWNSQDETGLPWTFLDQATDKSRIVAGAHVVAGHDDAIAIVEVVNVGIDGVVYIRPLPGPVSANLHRLSKQVS